MSSYFESLQELGLDQSTRCSSISLEESKVAISDNEIYQAPSRVKNLSIVDCEIRGLPKLLEMCGSE